MRSNQEHCGKQDKRLCVFEYIYFARPDSVIDGRAVQTARNKAGQILAMIHPVEADIVIGVPDSGLDAAMGFSRESGIPYSIGLIKNKYIGRTFIAPDGRLDQVKIKLAPVVEAVRNKRVVLVDDSIVRGTTCGRIIALLREAGAKEVHMRVSAPPFLHPCFYGTDIDSEDQLIAGHLNVSEIAEKIGADTLGYLPVEALEELAGGEGFCDGCFTGNYPTTVPQNVRKDRFEERLSWKEN